MKKFLTFFVVLSIPSPELDEKIAHYQLTTLLHEKRWVSEHDALNELEMLKNE